MKTGRICVDGLPNLRMNTRRLTLPGPAFGLRRLLAYRIVLPPGLAALLLT